MLLVRSSRGRAYRKKSYVESEPDEDADGDAGEMGRWLCDGVLGVARGWVLEARKGAARLSFFCLAAAARSGSSSV